MTIDFIVNQLNLQPHPEGGFYKEVYRSTDVITREFLPLIFSGSRAFSTSIYFLIKADSFSAFHKIKSDETWHFYFGHALEIIEIDEFGNLIKTMVGSNLIAGEVFQYTVKKNTWFASRVLKGGDFSLVGCSVSPGFDFIDFEMATRDHLYTEFPQHKTIINELTRL